MGGVGLTGIYRRCSFKMVRMPTSNIDPILYQLKFLLSCLNGSNVPISLFTFILFLCVQSAPLWV